MEYKYLGNTKEKVPVLGVGTWKMLGNEKNDIDTIRYAIGRGMALVDTAEMYGNEIMVGQAIRGFENVFIATKVAPHNFRYNDVINACNQSLKKLGVKQIDLYQLHWPNHSVPIKETMGALEQLKKDGKIRHIGVSNFDVREFEEAQASMKNSEIVSNQVEYSILTRDVEKDMIEYSRKNNITLIAYSPLASGALFSAKYQNLAIMLSSIGKKHGKTMAQVALNWLIINEHVIAIPKASSKAHVDENMDAIGWKLTKSEISEIDHFLSNIRKRPLSSIFTPIIKRNGFWSKYVMKRNEKASQKQNK